MAVFSKKRVFLSSTSRDLQEYRDAVYDGLSGLSEITCVRMEDFGAVDGSPTEVSLEKVKTSDVLVGLMGHNYGTIPKGYDKSITQLEYETAKEHGISRLMFLANEHFRVSISVRETDKKFQDQKAFREEVMVERSVGFFEEPNELAKKVKTAVSNHFEEGGEINIGNENYVIVVEANKSTKKYIARNIKGSWYFPIDDVDPYVKKVTIIPQSTLDEHLFDFTKGEIPEGASVDNPKFRAVGKNEKALLLERSTTNLLLDSNNPKNQTLRLNTSYTEEYILWVQGDGNVQVKGIVNGSATSDKPFKFKIYEDGLIVLKIVGKVETYQLEQGSVATSFIPTQDSTVTRCGSHLTISLPD